MASRDAAETGASSVEYGLLLAGVVALIVACVLVFGGAVEGLFGHSCSDIVQAQSVGSCA